MFPRKLFSNFIKTRTFGATTLIPRFCFSKVTETDVVIRPEVQEKVMYVMKLSPKCEHGNLTTSAKFSDLGFDSLEVVELIVTLEEHLGYDLPNEVAEGKIETVQDAIVQFSKYFPE